MVIGIHLKLCQASVCEQVVTIENSDVQNATWNLLAYKSNCRGRAMLRDYNSGAIHLKKYDRLCPSKELLDVALFEKTNSADVSLLEND